MVNDNNMTDNKASSNSYSSSNLIANKIIDLITNYWSIVQHNTYTVSGKKTSRTLLTVTRRRVY